MSRQSTLADGMRRGVPSAHTPNRLKSGHQRKGGGDALPQPKPKPQPDRTKGVGKSRFN
jgi:hypothetical protein